MMWCTGCENQMNVKIDKTSFEGLWIIEPQVFTDNRGHFFESYNKRRYQEAGIVVEFVQDNQSSSQKGVLRGLHYQKPPFAQMKLISVLSGVIQDVVVDLRQDQPTFGKHFSIELSFENKRQLLVPKGFAHGFLALSESVNVFYKSDEFYRPDAEEGLLFSDPSLAIDWKLSLNAMIVSTKDLQNLPLAQKEPVF